MGSALSKPVSLHSFSRNPGSRSLRKAREVRASLRAWAMSASAIRGWLWPWFTAEYEARKSM